MFLTLMQRGHMVVHTIPIWKSFVTKRTGIHKIVWKMNTLNVLDQVGLVFACFLADCTLKHIDLLEISPFIRNHNRLT